MARDLEQYRTDRFMTVKEFAEFLEVAEDTIYRIQRGERARFSTMKKIAKKLKVTPHEIAEFAPKAEG